MGSFPLSKGMQQFTEELVKIKKLFKGSGTVRSSFSTSHFRHNKIFRRNLRSQFPTPKAMRAPADILGTTTMNETDPKETFPSTLHRMLTEIDHLANRDASMAHLKSAISWQDHGMAFKIHDRKKFIELIMPQWFCRLKYTSFVRQLNLFGFKRIHKDGADKGAMYHEDFLRDMPELAAGIPKLKRNKRRPEAEKEPNFQIMPSHLQTPLPRPLSMPVTAVEWQQASPRAIGQGHGHFHDPHADESKSLERQPTTSMESLRDMLMPILPPGGPGDTSTAVARLHATSSTTLAMGNTESTDFDPFSNLWNTLDDATSTLHNEERLSLSALERLSFAALDGPLATSDNDLEPLRVFGPGDDNSPADDCHDAKRPASH